MNFVSFCWKLIEQLKAGHTKFKCKGSGFSLYPDGIVPIPTEEGYCWRFAHNIARIFLNRDLFPTPATNANMAYKYLKKLYPDHHELIPGSFIFWPGGRYGHVGIYLGDNLFLENTDRPNAIQETIIGAIKISKLDELANPGVIINIPALVKGDPLIDNSQNYKAY